MAISQAGTPSTPVQVTSGTGTVAIGSTATWGSGQNRTAPNLLVAVVTAFGSTTAGATAQNAGTTGWTKIREAVATTSVAAIWTKTATGGDAVPQFTSSISGTSGRTRLSLTLFELTDSAGSTPVEDTGNTATGTTGTLTVTTAGNVAASGEYAIAVENEGGTTNGTNTWGTSGSFSNAYSDAATSYSHWVIGTQSSPSSGSALSYAPSHTATSANEGGAISVFKPGIPPANYPPSLIMYAETTWNTTGTSKATTAGGTGSGSITWQAGDLVIALYLDEGGTVTITTPTFAGGTFTAWGTAVGNDSTHSPAMSWYCIPASGGSGAVTFGQNVSNNFGGAVWVWRYTNGIGNRAALADTTLTVSLTRAGNHSCVCEVIADWSATAVAGAWTPTAANARQAGVVSTHYTYYVADFGDQGSAGSTSYGRTATSGTWTKLAVEILGSAAGPPGAGMIPPLLQAPLPAVAQSVNW